MSRSLDLQDYQIVLSKVASTGVNFTNETMDVVFTETMKNGSIVNNEGVQVAVADAATAYGVIDDLTIRNIDGQLEAGDALTVSVAVRGNIFNEPKLVFVDGTVINTTAKNALKANMNTFSSVTAAS